MKYPSAWIPILLSGFSLILALIAIAVMGVPATPPTDEGIGAHLFQLWLVVDVLLVLFFATKWLPREPRAAIGVLVVQVAAIIAACSPVFILGL